MTKPSALTTKPDPLPLPKTIFTTLAWTRSTMSARDDLPSSDKSAAPMIWTLTVVLGVGVEVGTGVFGLVNRGNFAISGVGVFVWGEGSAPAGTPLSPLHPVPTTMTSVMTAAATTPLIIGTPLRHRIGDYLPQQPFHPREPARGHDGPTRCRCSGSALDDQ